MGVDVAGVSKVVQILLSGAQQVEGFPVVPHGPLTQTPSRKVYLRGNEFQATLWNLGLGSRQLCSDVVS